MAVAVKWNRDYNAYIHDYAILRSDTGRSGIYSGVSSGILSTTTQFFDPSGSPHSWYRIVSSYANGATVWYTNDDTSQYFSAGLVPTQYGYIHDEVSRTGGQVRVVIGSHYPNDTATVTIGGVAATITLDDNGYASALLTIPTDAATGAVSITWTSSSFSQSIVLGDRASYLVDVLEEDVLTEFQHIMTHHEGVVETNLGNSIYKFAFANWNDDIEPQFLINSTDLYTANPCINYRDGIVGLYGVEANADVMGTYGFKFFTRYDLYQYLVQSCNELNLIRPFTTYTLADMPDQWDSLVVQGAYRWALRRILQSLIFRDMRLTTIGDGAVSIIQALLNEASTTWTNIRKDAKRRGMALPGVIVSGKYRMPIRVTGMNWQQYVGIVS